MSAPGNQTQSIALDSKKIPPKISPKITGSVLMRPPEIDFSKTKDKSDHGVTESHGIKEKERERAGSFDDYIRERLRVPSEKKREEREEFEGEADERSDYYEEDNYEDHNLLEEYDSFEEEDYFDDEHIEKADAHPTTVRAGGGGKNIPFHSGKGTRAREANVAKGTVLLPNGNILIK
jgi:hypothetical protein